MMDFEIIKNYPKKRRFILLFKKKSGLFEKLKELVVGK